MAKLPIEKPLDTYIDGNSRLERYWNDEELEHNFRQLVKGKLPKDFVVSNTTIEKLIDKFDLRGIQFGNWVTLEDKFNYLAVLHLSMLDLNRVTRFKTLSIGQNMLSVSFGSRGSGGALAHFEPSTLVINITRYKRQDVIKKQIEAWGGIAPREIPKLWRFLNTGGIGSFAHEYGHFLDYYVGNFIEPVKGYQFLSGRSHSVSTKKVIYSNNYPLHLLCENIMQNIYQDKNGNRSRYMKKISGMGDYINMRQEIFARVFEQYVFEKLKSQKRVNKFLAKRKYNRAVYLRPTELRILMPMIDQLMGEIRRVVK